MDLELLVVEGCPHTQAATDLLRTALQDLRLTDIAVTTTVVGTARYAEVRGFTGSPSIFADGEDLFPQPAVATGLTCRLYRQPNGSHNGLPDAAELRRSLRKAAARRHSD